MKNVIMYNYNIETENLLQLSNGNYSFYVDYSKFYFIKINRVPIDIETIYKTLSSVFSSYHKIIKNRFNSILSDYNEEKYILLNVVTPEHDELLIKDILTEQVPYNQETIINRSNWGDLWSKKVDYLEYQMSELASGHKIAIQSFSYFVGLAENAIEYFNLLKIENTPKVLSHRRINYPLMSMDYYNPLELIVDYRSRDLAEYVKIKFYNGEDVREDIREIIKNGSLSPLEYNLFFIRLLYPTNYFDDLQKVIEKNEDDDILLKYIDRTEDYEKLLNKIAKEISNHCTLLKIDWLIKKES